MLTVAIVVMVVWRCFDFDSMARRICTSGPTMRASRRSIRNSHVYEVTVTQHEGGPPSCSYSASLGLVHSLKAGRIVSVEMHISDTFGPTADEAGRSLDASVTMWQPEVNCA
jgi:hypothetical protein